MAPSPSYPPLPVTAQQHAAKPHANPQVQGRKGSLGTVFEVLEPASQRCVEAGDDRFPTAFVPTPRQPSDSVLEAHQALLALPLTVSLEVVAEEVEPLLVNPHHPRLLRMKCEPTLAHHLPETPERRVGFPSGRGRRATRSRLDGSVAGRAIDLVDVCSAYAPWYRRPWRVDR